MTRRWQDGTVISVGLRGGRRAVGQMLASPYLQFFHHFVDDGATVDGDLRDKPLLFCTAVTRQFVRFSDLRKAARVRPHPGLSVPTHWIATHDGWREKVVWPGTPHQRKLKLMGGKPGGILIEKGNYGVGAEIEPDETEIIGAHELNRVWTFPQLNERLYLCDLLGKLVAPLRDLVFDRPLPPEARTFVDIIACHGELEDWGYRVPAKYAAKRAAALKEKHKARPPKGDRDSAAPKRRKAAKRPRR